MEFSFSLYDDANYNLCVYVIINRKYMLFLSFDIEKITTENVEKMFK